MEKECYWLPSSLTTPVIRHFLASCLPYHTYPNDKLMASPAVQRRVIAASHEAFPHVGLMARTALGDAGRQAWLGFHDDMFPEDTDNGHDWSFLAVIRRAGRIDNWQRAPIGGEMVPHMKVESAIQEAR